MHTALITGASRGIGEAIAIRLASEGYQVLTPTRAELNLSSNESIDSFLKEIQYPVDILINDAGINRIALLDRIQMEDLMEIMQVNLLAAFRLTQAVVPSMRYHQFGRIVNISSIWSVVSLAGRTSYAISKAAINSMTRSLAIELGPNNILINAVAPGYVMTDLTRENNSPEDLDIIRDKIPIKRLADPIEIANVVLFLCSEQNSYITGQTIIVDGGYTCL